MIFKIFKKNRIKETTQFVEPDEIFLDSHNLQNFNRQQFEGRIEKPITQTTILFLGLFFTLAVLIFFIKLGYLQIARGETYLLRSENNILTRTTLFADRGIIYDRNKIEQIGRA